MRMHIGQFRAARDACMMAALPRRAPCARSSAARRPAMPRCGPRAGAGDCRGAGVGGAAHRGRSCSPGRALSSSWWSSGSLCRQTCGGSELRCGRFLGSLVWGERLFRCVLSSLARGVYAPRKRASASWKSAPRCGLSEEVFGCSGCLGCSGCSGCLGCCLIGCESFR